MDEITRTALQNIADKNANSAVVFSHQFLDGVDGRGCGFVPSEWNGKTIYVTGKWWGK